MKINISEPDLGTVVSRINKNVIDLQPDFQRGDVWAVSKRKKLIDSILRGWQIPPIHVIRQDKYFHEVLDGQQRLRAIQGFFNNEFPVSGNFEPIDEKVSKLDGLLYSELPDSIKRSVEFYSIRILEVYDYLPGETGELFNRLNQSLNLTAAEKRNAQVGKTRKQIKSLSARLDTFGLDSKFIGFSNTRLAHDDLFARLCMYLEKGGVRAKVSDSELYEKYRRDELFDEQTVAAVVFSLETLSEVKEKLSKEDVSVHITKASFFSWILFISEMYMKSGCDLDPKVLIDAFVSFETSRFSYKNNLDDFSRFRSKDIEITSLFPLFSLFNERASSRVMTTSSLLIRDWCISLFYSIQSLEVNCLDDRRKREVGEILLTLNENKQRLKQKVETMAELGDANG
ncbi:DUF262 domain-containing protein [Alteromonas antoniana]|uniref:DUF262 domain-containing protein n=1 Tax=Alteromonas antoniana TaxID=2803813 RepID=UPI001C45AC27